jgi:hypothetical protein
MDFTLGREYPSRSSVEQIISGKAGKQCYSPH